MSNKLLRLISSKPNTIQLLKVLQSCSLPLYITPYLCKQYSGEMCRTILSCPGDL